MSATPIDILTAQTAASAVYEPPFAAIAAFTLQTDDAPAAALDTARSVLLGTLADLFLALNRAEGMRAVRALLPGNIQPGGARVPGTSYELEPCTAASVIGRLMSGASDRFAPRALRSCPLGAALAVADFADRKRAWRGIAPLTVRGLLNALIRAEQVRRALERSSALAMSELHCLLGATTAVTLSMLPGDVLQIDAALQRVWQSTATPLLPADLHAEAVRRTFGAQGSTEPLTAATSKPVIGEVFAAQPIVACDSHEHGAALQRFEAAVQTRLPLKQCERIKAILAQPRALDGMAVNAFMAELVANQA